MFTRMILFVFLVFTLTGCATGSKKQAAQSQPVTYEKSQKTYQQESDTWSSESYEKPAKKPILSQQYN